MLNYMIRKLLVYGIFSLFIGVSFTVLSISEITVGKLYEESFTPFGETFDNKIPFQYYSHIVFVGIATSQNCKPCHTWNENIHEAYMSGEYDFEYVEMIEFDHNGQILNQIANEWSESFNIGSYPTSIFDRDYQRVIGDQPDELSEAFDLCGNRLVKDITASMNLYWLEDGKIQVDVVIQNNENNKYDGHIRAFITEILSRYDTYYGEPYNFGFLDYAFDNDISINAGGIYTDSIIWDGNEHADEHGDDFGDIDPDNIQVTTVVYNDDDGYTDETIIARVNGNNPPDAPMISGSSSGNAGEEYDYIFITNDFNDDKVYYYIEWGDGDIEEWIGPYNSSEEVILSHKWEEEGTYNIRAKAKDVHGAESLWSNLEITMPLLKQSTYFLILRLLDNIHKVFPIVKQIIWFTLNL